MSIKFNLIASEWKDDHGDLPCEFDFDPYGGDLDAQHAWRQFGGLTRTEAFSKFLADPFHFSEDFMFMGDVAFAHYYPVIERFLCDESIGTEFCHRYAWVLGESILFRFEVNDVNYLSRLRERVLTLTETVRGNISRYSLDDADQERINDTWNRLAATMTALDTPLSHD